MKLDLSKTTFIIPVYIESLDRALNTRTTLRYLTTHLATNIIILEHDTVPKVPAILKELDLENKLSYVFSKNTAGNDVFHRTRFLNEMLHHVKTPVVVNYDIDIILKPEVYLECQNSILNGNDLVYPYYWGDSQWQIHNSGRDKIVNSLDLSNLVPEDYTITRSEYGHCQFFNTASYKEGGMENEHFISYGPEDKERGYRFKTLGYKVEWLNNIVNHIEHSRGINSSSKNPHIKANHDLLDAIQKMTAIELRNYYNNIDYLKKYK
jgi:hypothetical protein